MSLNGSASHLFEMPGDIPNDELKLPFQLQPSIDSAHNMRSMFPLSCNC